MNKSATEEKIVFCPKCENFLLYHINSKGNRFRICVCGYKERVSDSRFIQTIHKKSEANLKISKLLEKMNITKLNKSLITRILTHPSYRRTNIKTLDYRPLDYIGDAVIDLIVREQLVRKNELGSKSRRNILVSNAYLAIIFDLLQLEKNVKKAPNYSLNEHDKGSIIEGFFGAFYQEFGISDCKKLWNRLNNNLKGLSR